MIKVFVLLIVLLIIMFKNVDSFTPLRTQDITRNYKDHDNKNKNVKLLGIPNISESKKNINEFRNKIIEPVGEHIKNDDIITDKSSETFGKIIIKNIYPTLKNI